MDPNQQVQPQPRPTTWGFDHVETGSHLVLIISTEQGQAVHFITPDVAEGIIGMLKAQRRHCLRIQNGGSVTELVIPSQPFLGADGQPIMVVPPSAEVQDAGAQREERGHGLEPGDVEPWPKPVDEPDAG